MSDPAQKCTLCEFTCRSKPSLLRHTTLIHLSTKVKAKPTKKRAIQCFTCMSCQSTFDTRYKMKKHTQKEHNVEEDPKSPVRKLPKTIQIDDNKDSENQQTEALKPNNKNRRNWNKQ